MEDKEIRPICLYKETCLDFKQGKRNCEDCIHNKDYWTEVQLRDMAQNIRRLEKEKAELKAENERLKRELSGKRFICPQCMEFAKEIHKYKQTLQEIKEIALLGTNTYKEEENPNSLSTWKNAQFEKIIALITKAESEG